MCAQVKRDDGHRMRVGGQHAWCSLFAPIPYYWSLCPPPLAIANVPARLHPSRPSDCACAMAQQHTTPRVAHLGWRLLMCVWPTLVTRQHWHYGTSWLQSKPQWLPPLCAHQPTWHHSVCCMLTPPPPRRPCTRSRPDTHHKHTSTHLE
jgi:hypothetical protein